MKTKSIILLAIFIMTIVLNMKSETVNAIDFVKGNDATPGIYEAIKYCKLVGAKKIIFPKGRYEFRPDYASEEYLFISNNDSGLKRFAFNLTGMDGFEVDGQGSEFIFHGFISPFLLNNSKNIEFKNFSIDYKRTFHSEGQIISACSDSIDVYFPSAYPYKVENNVLIFTDDEGRVYPWSSLLEFDPQKRETAYKVVDYWCGPYAKVKELEKGMVRVYYPGLRATAGNVMAFCASHRLVPAFNIMSSENISFFHIDLYHCGGMGIVAQMSRNITIDNIRVCPAPESGRIISLTADATHFVNCSGYIKMTNCLFECQKDDATNIHGLYAQIDQILSSKELLVRMAHPQQFGVDFIFPEYKVEFVESESLNTYSDNIALKTERINNEYTKVIFENPIPDKVKRGDGIASIEGYPEVLIKNCTIKGNRARGILLGSRAKIIIEDNYFHASGAAILLEGDCSFWYEQAGVRDLIVRNNIFDNCFYGTWGNAIIQVGSGIKDNKRDISRYNRNILIENNVFNIFTPEILNLYSVDGLVFKNNTINKTTAYPCTEPKKETFIVRYSSNIEIDDKFKF